jgi:hypothetical protein
MVSITVPIRGSNSGVEADPERTAGPRPTTLDRDNLYFVNWLKYFLYRVPTC